MRSSLLLRLGSTALCQSRRQGVPLRVRAERAFCFSFGEGINRGCGRQLSRFAAIWLDSSEPRQRSEFLRDPGELVERCRGLPVSKEPVIVVVDEAQAVPGIFDAVQLLRLGYSPSNLAPGHCTRIVARQVVLERRR